MSDLARQIDASRRQFNPARRETLHQFKAKLVLDLIDRGRDGRRGDIELFGGMILLILAVMFIVWGVISLGLQRAQGSELGSSKRGSSLITTGAYAFCRHPQTLGFIFATPAFALIFDFVPLLIVALLYTPLLLALLGYEEVDLLRRFGDSYGVYRETVPFIIPRRKRIVPQK